jgi:putative membrane protein
LSQLAQQNALSSDVRNLGKMLEKDHNQSMSDLKILAKKKQMTIPDAPTDDIKNEYKKLNDKKGKNFDKDFCDKMVNGHKDAISTFEKASKEANDKDIKAWATQVLPTLRMHLDHAIFCQKKTEKI